MDELIAFLDARYSEREQIARAAGAASWHATQEETTDGHNVYSTLWADGEGDTFAHTYDAEADKVQHIADWDPKFVLADIAAKRQIIGLVTDAGPQWGDGYTEAYRDVLRLLALPFASHPDYREEWRV